MERKDPLITGEFYHVYNKSIAGYKIFNFKQEFNRMMQLIKYCQLSNTLCSYSEFLRLKKVQNLGFDTALGMISFPHRVNTCPGFGFHETVIAITYN